MQGLQRINEVIIETFDRLDLLNSPDSDQFKSISTGIRDLDETITGLNRSDLILLAARPGMGKTSFALNIANHVAVKEKNEGSLFLAGNDQGAAGLPYAFHRGRGRRH